MVEKTTNPTGPRYSRRQTLTRAGGFALSIAASPLLSGRASAARKNELNLYAWDGDVTDPVLSRFQFANDCEIRTERQTSDPEAVTRLRAGETAIWDLVTLKNPWARKVLYPARLIRPLERERFEPYYERMLQSVRGPFDWATSDGGAELLGMAQRFGPFSFVVNTEKISRGFAEDQGFSLFLEPAMRNRFGILAYDHWNVLHICIAAGFSPFRHHDDAELARFDATARLLLRNARLMTPNLTIINNAIIHGEIDAYFSGGTYTAATMRFDGLRRIRGITPATGPMDSKGGVAWYELTSTVNNPDLSTRALDFLDYVQLPDVAKRIAFASGTHNPVTQMGDARVFGHFNSEELDAIQWESLDQDMARCVDYDVNPDYEIMLASYNAAKRERLSEPTTP